MTNYCQTTYETLPYHSATLLDDQPWMVQTVPCRIQEVRRDPMNRYHSQRGAIPRWLGPSAGLLALTSSGSTPYTERSQLLLGPESEEIQLDTQADEQTVHNPKVKFTRERREAEPDR